MALLVAREGGGASNEVEGEEEGERVEDRASSMEDGAGASKQTRGERGELAWLSGAVVSSDGTVHNWTWMQEQQGGSSSKAEGGSTRQQSVLAAHLSDVKRGSDGVVKHMWESMQKKEYGGDSSRENRKRGRNDKKLQDKDLEDE